MKITWVPAAKLCCWCELVLQIFCLQGLWMSEAQRVPYVLSNYFKKCSGILLTNCLCTLRILKNFFFSILFLFLFFFCSHWFLESLFNALVELIVGTELTTYFIFLLVIIFGRQLLVMKIILQLSIFKQISRTKDRWLFYFFIFFINRSNLNVILN